VAKGGNQMPNESRERQIRGLAYALWEQEGHPEGQAERHWLMAEKAVETTDGAERAATMNAIGASTDEGLSPAHS
jgi:hypothetical protein